MGNASYRQTTGNQFNNQDLRIYFQHDLPKFILQGKVGNGKFMKTYVMRVDSAPVVVKVYMKLADEDLLVPAAHLTIIWKTLSPAKYPNLLPYQMWIKSTARFNKTAATPIYLIRQYFSSNLYDRLSTRPFLNELEKLWIVYQLFKCLEICHEHGIVHGDIKPENVMCTTSNWVILTDFSPFKPAVIPDDDPTDFQYYFESMGRHRCYLAPERFQHKALGATTSTAVEEPTSGPQNFRSRLRGRSSRGPAPAKKGLAAANASAFPSSTLTPAMDVFALGCLAAEVLLDGVPLLDLPGMLKYVATTHTTTTSGERVPLTRLDQDESTARSLLMRIPNVHIRNVIIDMTQKDPLSRLTVSEYLDILQGKTSIEPGAPIAIETLPTLPTTLLPPTPPFNSTAPGSNPVASSGTQLPPRPPSTTAAAAQAALTVFPGYFDSGLYPLFLKMHWNGVTPDDRINLICQSYGDLIRSIAGIEDAPGAAFFSSALAANTSSRTPAVVLAADPTASAKKIGTPTAANGSSAVNASSAGYVRGRSFDTDVAGAGVSTAVSTGPVGVNARAALLSKASGAFLRDLHAGTATTTTIDTAQGFKPLSRANSLLPTPTESITAGANSSVDSNVHSTEYLLARSEELILEMEKLFNPNYVPTSTTTSAITQKAEHLSAAALSNTNTTVIPPRARVGEDNILRQGSGPVSASIISSASAGRTSVSWGGVQERVEGHAPIRPQHEGVVVIVDILHANYRHLKYPQSKIVCLMVLLRVGVYCSDAVILQRAVPLLLLGLEDQCAVVRAMAVRALRALLVLVRQFSAAESNIFPLYIFPSLTRISKDPEPSVRIAFAESVGCFAETAKRFLDVTHLALLNKAIVEQNHSSGGSGSSGSETVFGENEIFGAPVSSVSGGVSGISTSVSNVSLSSVPTEPDNSSNSSSVIAIQFPYDQKLEQLKEQVSRWIRDLMLEFTVAGNNNTNATSLNSSTYASNSGAHTTSTENRRVCTVKRILLMDIMRLCSFFGQESTMDRLLTQLLTFLNDQDWELRHAFCAKIPSVCAFLGPTVTAECILPCIENAIYDVEEKVVLCAVHSLTSLVQLQLLSNLFIVDFVTKCKCLLLHPSESLRQASVEFVSVCATALGTVDAAVFILPLVRSAMKYDLSGLPLTTTLLSHALVAGIGRRAYRAALLKRLSQLSAMYTSSEGGTGPVESISIVKGAPVDVAQEAEDSRKIALIQSYIDLAAREINTKTMQWRNGLASSVHQQALQQQQQALLLKNTTKQLPNSTSNANLLRHVGPLSVNTTDPTLPRNSLYSLLDLTSLPMPEHTIQSLLIPHQKYGASLYRPLSEDVRRHPILLDMDGLKNSNKLKNLFGVTMRQGDSARALAVGSQWENSEGLQDTTAATTAGGLSALNPAYGESLVLLKRIRAMDVPPLAPDTGHLMQPTPDNRFYSAYTEPLDTSSSLDGPSRAAWRPKEGVLLTTLKEHSGAVNRLIVSPDQSFFASGSSDKTVKIWQTRQLDRVAFPKSAVTYKQHKGEVIDLAPIENSHSIASASTDGAIHVWRVDMVGSSGSSTATNASGSAPPPPSAIDTFQDDFTANMGNIGVTGLSQVRIIDPSEGAVLCVNHFNSDVASLVTYATQRGGMHGWDLRAAREAMHLPLRPELGYATSMTISPDRNWICLGTSKGFVSLFDIRYNVPSKLWRHSSHSAIHRLACCKAPGAKSSVNATTNAGMPQSEGAFLFVAAGNNEAAVWGIPEGGECCKCFRSVSLDACRGPVAPLPSLEEISLPRRPHAAIHFQDSTRTLYNPRDDSVRAIIGRISQSNMSYLVTAGTDRSIRFWDFSAPSKCFTISGLEAAQPKAIFDAPKLGDGTTGKLFVCYVAATPSADKILQMHLPAREGRGIVLPSPNAKDAILDLKNLDLPMKLMLSSSRDGEIKLWR